MKKLFPSNFNVRMIYLFTVLFLIGLTLYTYIQLQNLIASSHLVNHANLVNLSLQKISTGINNAETNQRGFLLTGDSTLLAKKNVSVANLLTDLNTVQFLSKDNATQVENFKALHLVMNAKIAIMQKVLNHYSTLQMSPELRAAMLEGVIHMGNVEKQIKKMTDAEEEYLKLQVKKYSRLSFFAPFFIVILFVGALGVLLVSYLRLNNTLNHSKNLQSKLEAEKTLAQTIFDSSPDSIVVLDKELKLISANAQAGRMLNQQPVVSLMEHFSENKTLSDLEKALQGQTVHNANFYSSTTNLNFEITYTPLKKENEVIGIVSQIRDITSIVKTNKQLEKQNEELEKMNVELESFAYVASHDLQEPLRKIQTFSAIILEKEALNLSANGKDYFRRIQNAADRMRTLIEDLLAFSRVGTSERKFELTNLNTLVTESIKEFNEIIVDKQATIEVAVMCTINIIPFQFQQLLQNLIGNALKFSKPETPPLILIKSKTVSGAELSNEKLKPEKKYCHLTVEDNGVGFEPEFNERVFDIFLRLHGRSHYEGTGIGLAIVKKIVENHRGIITARGELNKGACFDIYIPVS